MATFFQMGVVWFLSGLFLKIGLIIGLDQEWPQMAFLPALEGLYLHYLTTNSPDFAIGPFPYGLGMSLSFLPMAMLLGGSLGLWDLSYHLTLTLFDVGVLIVLAKMFHTAPFLAKILKFYWFSPVVLICTYVYGFNDVIPIFFLMLGLCLLKSGSLKASAVAIAVAVSSKITMIIVVPFLFAFFWRNRNLRQKSAAYFSVIFLTLLVLISLDAVGRDVGESIFLNAEVFNAYQVALTISQTIEIYAVPLILLLYGYVALSLRRMNHSILMSMVHIALLTFVLLVPSSPGWFVWGVPFLAIYFGLGGIRKALLSCLFALTTTLASVVSWPDFAIFIFPEALAIQGLPLVDDRLPSLIFTAVCALGVVLIVDVARHGIFENQFFRLTRSPVLIGISGDSGAGKDTLSDSLKVLFGELSVTQVSGDDYHIWDRQGSRWKTITHLNPRANDLEKFKLDVQRLVRGEIIKFRHYDHKTGRKGQLKRSMPKDVIIVSGLHSLYSSQLYNMFDAKIFLDMDDGLRRYLKVHRDVNQRKRDLDYTIQNLKVREPDALKYIKPQRKNADLAMSLLPSKSIDLSEEFLASVGADSRVLKHLRLKVQMKPGTGETDITRLLVGLFGLHVNLRLGDDTSPTEIVIDGDISSEDIGMCAKMLAPNVVELLPSHKTWMSGTVGLMQLFTVQHLEQSLNSGKKA